MKLPDPGVSLHLATVGLGSNLGDRESTILEAIRWLTALRGNRLTAYSSLYETEPYGKTDQGWFLNCVIQMETSRELKDFFHILQQCETLFGRTRKERWEPRTLDLDLLFFDDVVYTDSELTVPHPGVPHRRFVLEPLCEVSPNLVHPSLDEKVCALLDRLAEPSRVICLGRPSLVVSC